MQAGNRVKVKDLPFIVCELHGKPGTVTKTKEFTDHSGTYTSVWVKLDEPVKLKGASWLLEEAVFSSECYEIIHKERGTT